jgi:endoglucanase
MTSLTSFGRHGLRWGRLVLLGCSGCLALSSHSKAQAAPPLHTEGSRILDAAGKPIRLTSVNWYGFDEKEFVAGGLDHAPLETIVTRIQEIGVNSVRLPWANETLERNPIVSDYAVRANPAFKGKHAMDVMDAVIDALARAHLMVILDNHVSRADWCCSETDGNGLWWSQAYPEDRWLADWATMAGRYRDQNWVVGADLRNELRNGASWGGTDRERDWHRGAERGGAAVLGANPRLLIMVEGPHYSTDFSGVPQLPVSLPVKHRLVYSPHAYFDASHPFASYAEMKQAYEARADALLDTGVPLWIGEFGTCQTLRCGANAEWFHWFVRLLAEDPRLSWSYWPLNGTQSSGAGRRYDAVETYGLLTSDYRAIVAKEIVSMLRTVETRSVPRSHAPSVKANPH